MNIQNVLRTIGLTEYESKVYLALVDLGKARSGEILETSRLNTGKIYDILGSLKNKGFISEVIESGVRKFFPADPKQIVAYLENKKVEIQKQEDVLEKIIPDLMKKINSTSEPQKVEVFYGIKGLKTAHRKEIERYLPNETIRILGIMGRDQYPKSIYNHFINNIYPHRINSKIKIKKILDLTAKKYKKDHEKKAQIKYFPYVSPVGIITIGNLTIIDIASNNPITITIESNEVANSFIQQFELLWKLAKKN